MSSPARSSDPVDLQRYAWLSIVAAILNIALKAGAWWVTQSMGLFSDAAESTVNLVAAVVALLALRAVVRPANRGHNYGLWKAEYLSAAVEGGMIFVAAIAIIYQAIPRLLHPQPIDNGLVGVGIAIAASVLNGSVAWVLARAGRKHRSLTLIADSKHLLADVWTSAGVVAGIVLVLITKIHILDPIIALLVGVNIIVTGTRLIRESGEGLLDASMPREENEKLAALLRGFAVHDQISFHALRTRVAGRQRFAEVHVLVPGDWTVKQGHDLCERIEARVHGAFADLSLVCHLEPIEDPVSYRDIPAVHIPVDVDDVDRRHFLGE